MTYFIGEDYFFIKHKYLPFEFFDGEVRSYLHDSHHIYRTSEKLFQFCLNDI